MNNYTDNSETLIVISNPRLKVTMASPGTYYKGARFDWTGFITRIELDGAHTFCVPESFEPGMGTGGSGLCNEFGIKCPIGYEEVEPGEKFPKLGVGLLTKKDNSPYFFAYPYEVEPFSVSVSSNVDCVQFVTETTECNGYMVKYTKEISLKENRIIINYSLENTGEKCIKTTEYSHNFFGIDGHSVGPEYILKFPFDVELIDIPEAKVLKSEGNIVTWKETPAKDFYNEPSGFVHGVPHVWELIHVPSGVGVKEISNFPVTKVALWGSTHVISPEVFIDINIAPGEVQVWTRVYEFFRIK